MCFRRDQAEFEKRITANSLRIAQRYKNFGSVDAYSVAWGVLGGRHAHGFAVLHIELRTVTGTNQALAIELPISQRAAIMRAHVFNAEDLTREINQNNESLIDFEGLWGILGQFVPFANILVVEHTIESFPSNKLIELDPCKRLAVMRTYALAVRLFVLTHLTCDYSY